mmetsp:Transcript_26989/g.67736  ORF Transcript_26989/g.67736 Transcript_26989/m.67736 type:complete len:104 (-) Transcript_26989:8-319(-)
MRSTPNRRSTTTMQKATRVSFPASLWASCESSVSTDRAKLQSSLRLPSFFAPARATSTFIVVSMHVNIYTTAADLFTVQCQHLRTGFNEHRAAPLKLLVFFYF